jgi:hypothetical protein
MVFELPFEDKKLYVKLATGEIDQVNDDGNDELVGIVAYMSFHPEESKMVLPLKEGGES